MRAATAPRLHAAGRPSQRAAEISYTLQLHAQIAVTEKQYLTFRREKDVSGLGGPAVLSFKNRIFKHRLEVLWGLLREARGREEEAESVRNRLAMELRRRDALVHRTLEEAFLSAKPAEPEPVREVSPVQSCDLWAEYHAFCHRRRRYRRRYPELFAGASGASAASDGIADDGADEDEDSPVSSAPTPLSDAYLIHLSPSHIFRARTPIPRDTALPTLQTALDRLRTAQYNFDSRAETREAERFLQSKGYTRGRRRLRSLIRGGLWMLGSSGGRLKVLRWGLRGRRRDVGGLGLMRKGGLLSGVMMGWLGGEEGYTEIGGAGSEEAEMMVGSFDGAVVETWMQGIEAPEYASAARGVDTAEGARESEDVSMRDLDVNLDDWSASTLSVGDAVSAFAEGRDKAAIEARRAACGR